MSPWYDRRQKFRQCCCHISDTHILIPKMTIKISLFTLIVSLFGDEIRVAEIWLFYSSYLRDMCLNSKKTVQLLLVYIIIYKRCNFFGADICIIEIWQCFMQWKGINRKQSTRWQHRPRLKASAFFSLQKNLVVMKHSNLYLGLVLPSGGWQSLIGVFLRMK